MKIPRKETILRHAAECASEFYDVISALKDLPLEQFEPDKTALIVNNMVNGFAKHGALYHERIGDLIAPVAQVAAAAEKRGFHVLAPCDAHRMNSIEMEFYPPHCLEDTDETEICDELMAACPSMLRIDQNCSNAAVERGFWNWQKDHPQVDTYIVIGCCTDISLLQFTQTLKAWHNTRDLPAHIFVPVALVDTFDFSHHPADMYNATAMYLMRSAGVYLCRDICLSATVSADAEHIGKEAIR